MSGAVLSIDLGAVAANVRHFASIQPGFTAVVKADGFGHGAVDVATVAIANGAARLGVTGIDEAMVLRKAGITAPILSWLNPIDADFDTAIRNRVAVTAGSVALLERIAGAAAVSGQVSIHLAVDTGMTREGAGHREWVSLCRRARDLERRRLITIDGIMSHLACADDPDHPANRSALARFDDAIRVAARAGIVARSRHLAATAATLDIPEARLDDVRVGAGLYGIDPAGRGRLRPALTLTAPVVEVRTAPAGSAVGYGRTFRIDDTTRLALLPIGYADGIPRAAAGIARVSLGGRHCRIVGAISMDQIVVDVGTADVRIGDVATVFGPGDQGEPRLADWAVWCHTIEHELMTGIGRRVARRVVPSEAVPDIHHWKGLHESLC
ncbi:alanine racemase [Stackebrandtia endophytica]|uniref:Alanine racemase n=1 Tax=Stackebrandtia endophytica TaxID=1496996 RepID=A0A543B3K4_9ACTN|nr:alanine racemase [Stackebrandtia endophytica]TQL79421.1 alanine racemase [Stackebrandtia endophytica]